MTVNKKNQTPTDYLGNEIRQGDTIYNATLAGRSAILSTSRVREIREKDGAVMIEKDCTNFRVVDGEYRDVPNGKVWRGRLIYPDRCIVDLSKRGGG